jgi:protoporphyrinogen oxidase
MEALFKEVGARYDVRSPRPGVLVRVGRRRTIDTTSPLSRLLIDRVALGLAGAAVRRWPRPAADGAPSLASWLGRLTSNRVATRIARNLAAGSFGVNSDEVSAHAIFTFLTQKGAFRRYGFGPRGTGGVLDELAQVVRSGSTAP